MMKTTMTQDRVTARIADLTNRDWQKSDLESLCVPIGTIKKTIVIAWVEKTKLIPNGRLRHIDRYNVVEDFDVAWEGKAAVWLNKGDENDLIAARAYVAQSGLNMGMVIELPTTEPEPLAVARKLAEETATLNPHNYELPENNCAL